MLPKREKSSHCWQKICKTHMDEKYAKVKSNDVPLGKVEDEYSARARSSPASLLGLRVVG